MRKIKKRIFQLIVGLLIAKSRYTEVIVDIEDDNLLTLLIEAREQKNLQFLEICRLFEIDKTETVLSREMDLNNTNQDRNNIPVGGLIKENEEYIKGLYQSILTDEDVSKFESFVLSKHLKGEEILLKKIST